MSLVSLLYRTADLLKWGAGKGANLDASEIDQNFWDLQEAVNALTTNPAEPHQIDDITQTDNAITIHMNDGVTTYGPFALPFAAYKWRGPWAQNTDYKIGDVFTVPHGIYATEIAFTSGLYFDPNFGGVGGAFAHLIFPYDDRQSIGFFYPAEVGVGIETGQPMFSFLTDRGFTIPVNATDSIGTLRTATAATLSLEVRVDGVAVGTVNFAAGSKVATFDFGAPVVVEAGQYLDVMRPATFDATAMNLNLTFAVTKNTEESSS